MTFNRIAVFCGSNFGDSPDYAEAAAALGRCLAARGIGLVYGGTHKGLMGVVADAVLGAGGAAHGVITEGLAARGHLHAGLSSHEVVADMRQRKARMAALADGFIALPGGLGTMEELFEAATLTQLGDHDKPCGGLNVRGFFDPLRGFLQHMVAARFLRQAHCDMLLLETAPDALIDAMAAWRPPVVEKWFAPPQSR